VTWDGSSTPSITRVATFALVHGAWHGAWCRADTSAADSRPPEPR